MQPNPTLDQLQVLLAIEETGSFSAAGRKLNRAQSVISYTIANLEAQLGLKLFARDGTREPKLTAEGKAMLPDARRMLGVLQDIRSRAEGLKQGLEAELSIAVDVSLPSPTLVEVLTAFEAAFPTVALRLNVGALGMVWEQLLNRQMRRELWRPARGAGRRSDFPAHRRGQHDAGRRARIIRWRSIPAACRWTWCASTSSWSFPTCRR